jgi:hypothetical protein
MINDKEKRDEEEILLSNNRDKLLEESKRFLEENFKDLDISDYYYKIDDALDELYIDEEILRELIEDFVVQILKSKSLYCEYIRDLKKDKQCGVQLDYTDIRNLAHKNLGAAKNLRIADAQKFLEIIMYENDLDRLKLSVKGLESCVIKLNPSVAFDTLKLN